MISVTNKDGVVDFASGLVKLGFEIVSTGGTMKVLEDNGVHCIAIDDVTGFPEMLDGRVKTLHPKVHGGLLFKRDNPEHVKTVQEHHIQRVYDPVWLEKELSKHFNILSVKTDFDLEGIQEGEKYFYICQKK